MNTGTHDRLSQGKFDCVVFEGIFQATSGVLDDPSGPVPSGAALKGTVLGGVNGGSSAISCSCNLPLSRIARRTCNDSRVIV